MSNPTPLRDHEFRIGEVAPGSVLRVGTTAVFNVGGRFCAAQVTCTHRGGGLLDGGSAEEPDDPATIVLRRLSDVGRKTAAASHEEEAV
jgi:hypothetical protein